jgi:hypothetical protein
MQKDLAKVGSQKEKGYTFKRGRSTLFIFTRTCGPTFARSFCMIHMVGNFWKYSFTCNKWDIL